MAIRICFVPRPNDYPKFEEVKVEFKYYGGFAVSQKQKSINALHESINRIDKTLNILEISTKSTNPLGVALSAFNLKFVDEYSDKEYPIENIFQSSKVFENGGPYKDLLNVPPKDAKRDERLRTSGKLKYFTYNDTIWELEPKTLFYDWIYNCFSCFFNDGIGFKEEQKLKKVFALILIIIITISLCLFVICGD